MDINVDVKRVYNSLETLENEFKYILGCNDTTVVYWKDKKKTVEKTADNIKGYDPKLAEILLALTTVQYKNKYSVKAKEVKPYIEDIYREIKAEMERLKPYMYISLLVDGNYYQAKTVIYDDSFRYMLMSFQSRQQLNVFLSNLQKGLKRNKIGGSWEDISSIKNGYEADYLYVSDENVGDGVHAKIYNTDNNTLIVKSHLEESPVTELYSWLKEHTKVALLDVPQDIAKYQSILETLNLTSEQYEDYVSLWKEYFFNRLRDKGLINECEVIDYTNAAPTVYVISEDVTPELIRELRTEGLKNKEIAIPVVKEVEVDNEMSFLDIIETFVIDDIQDEKSHYNLGEPISPIISSPIIPFNGKPTKLYPRQQIIAQGVYNAIADGKKSIFINGGQGIGKTYLSSKLAMALIKELNGKNKARLCIFAQQHIIPKWERQLNECLNPLGVYPKFYTIESYKDVFDLPEKPEGIEILLLPKDKVKRNYLYKYVGKEKYNTKNLRRISKFINGLEVGEREVTILREVKNLPIHLMKLAAKRIEKEHDKHTILVREQLDKEGNIKGHKVVTTSKLLKTAYGQSHKAYDFEIENLDNFIKEIQKNAEQLSMEKTNTRKPYIQNGLTCPSCGSFVYARASDIFDEEKHRANQRIAPKARSNRNNKCNHYIKADGTPLTQMEIEEIRKGYVNYIYTNQRVEVPYVDEERNPLTPEEVRQVKAGRYTGKYQVMITTCGHNMWEAHEGKGYRTVNAADMLLKRFGKKSFDLLIADEVHLFSKQSNQGYTFGKLCQLSKVKVGLTGTMTGGKSSDLYYLFWSMNSRMMVQRGYRYKDVNLFIDHYGRRKKITKKYLSDSKYNKSGKGRVVNGSWNEIPGISPLLYTHFLSGTMVSRKIEDMGIPMPNIHYYKHEIDMDDDLREGYDTLKQQMLDFMKENEDIHIGGSYLHQLLSYPDYPKGEPVYWNGTDLLIATPPKIELSKGKLLNKEKKLIETLKSEIKQNRRVLIYNSYSGGKGVSDRLMQIISEAGFKVAELTSKIKLETREEWIEEQYQNGVEVLVANPITVETGLDIIQYPTIYFYNLSYNIKTLRQAEARNYRLNQKNVCKIYYSFYKETLQAEAVKLVGSKKKASLALEGVFSEDMLSSMGSDTGESGSKMLFKILQGKVTLDEDNLDAFGFESDEVIFSDIEVNKVDKEQAIDIKVAIEEEREKAKQIDLFTITEQEIQEMKAKVKGSKKNKIEKEVIAGQMMLAL